MTFNFYNDLDTALLASPNEPLVHVPCPRQLLVVHVKYVLPVTSVELTI